MGISNKNKQFYSCNGNNNQEGENLLSNSSRLGKFQAISSKNCMIKKKELSNVKINSDASYKCCNKYYKP